METRRDGGAVRLAAAIATGLVMSAASAQLTVTPGRTAATVVDILSNPSAVAYDTAGNLFIADTNHHQIREFVKATGSTMLLAGTGIAGYTGDGAAATDAQLDTPSGVAVDTTGSIYIADSHNNVVRKITGTTITTIAGNGTRGFSGDGAAATAATLALPSAVAIDAVGDLYIADTRNHRIRKVTGSTITTVAGNGEELFAGDGGPAIAASLDSPTGVAVDTAGTLYIADRLNHRIRTVNTAQVISTLAGTGPPTFAGAFAGDGAAAAAASLSKPTGVAVDTAGNVYIADTNNQRIRQVGNGGITTVQGDGAQEFSGDGANSTASSLNGPKSVAPDPSGNLAVADTLDQRIRIDAQPVLSFADQMVGTASAAQFVTLANTGAVPLTVSAVTAATSFFTMKDGTCSPVPIVIAAGTSCMVGLAYTPASSGPTPGSVTFGGTNVPAQTILLAGSANPGATVLGLASNAAAPFINQAVTISATVTPQNGAGIPTGLVTFTSNGLPIGAVQTLTNGMASISTTFPAAGTYALMAAYSGDANYSASSAALSQLVGDFNFTIAPGSSTGTGSDYSVTVLPGNAAIYTFSVQPLNGPFTFPITLSATGLPPGATAAFNPQTLTLGATAVKFSTTIQTAKTTGALGRDGALGGVTLGLLLLPFAGSLRRRARNSRLLLRLFILLSSATTVIGISGCGSDTGFFGQPQTVYTVNVIATAQGSTGVTLEHLVTVKLVLQ